MATGNADPNIPATLGKEYAWRPGDTLALIACRYGKTARNDFLEILDLNRMVLERNRYLMREGDVIKIPEHWFPLTPQSFTTEFRGSHGTRISR